MEKNLTDVRFGEEQVVSDSHELVAACVCRNFARYNQATQMKDAQYRRNEQIGWVRKFNEDANNREKLAWMEAYESLLKGARRKVNPRILSTLESLASVEFPRILSSETRNQLCSDPELRTLVIEFEQASRAYIAPLEIKTVVEKYNEKYAAVAELPLHGKFEFFDSFDQVPNGPVALYTVGLPPSNFEGTDTMTFVLSIPERRVVYLIGHNGFPIWLGSDEGSMSEEEWKELGLDEV